MSRAFDPWLFITTSSPQRVWTPATVQVETTCVRRWTVRRLGTWRAPEQPLLGLTQHDATKRNHIEQTNGTTSPWASTHTLNKLGHCSVQRPVSNQPSRNLVAHPNESSSGTGPRHITTCYTPRRQLPVCPCRGLARDSRLRSAIRRTTRDSGPSTVMPNRNIGMRCLGPPSSLAKIGQGGCRRCRQPQVPNKYCASTVVVHRIDQPGEGHRTYAGAAAAKMERCRLPAFSAPAGEPLLPTTEGLPAESSFAHAASAGARSAATLCWRPASGICKSVSLFARHTNKPSGPIEGSMSDALLAVKAAHATVVFLSAPDCRSHLQHASQVPTAQPQSRRGLPSGRCVCVRSMPPGGSQCFCTQGAPIGLEDLLDMDAARLHALGSAQRYRTGDWGPLHCALPTFVQRHTVCVWRTPPCLGLQAPLRVSISRWICAAANCLRSAALLARLNHSPLCPNPTALLRLPDPWMSGHAKTPYEPTSVKRHWA